MNLVWDFDGFCVDLVWMSDGSRLDLEWIVGVSSVDLGDPNAAVPIRGSFNNTRKLA